MSNPTLRAQTGPFPHDDLKAENERLLSAFKVSTFMTCKIELVMTCLGRQKALLELAVVVWLHYVAFKK